MLDGLKNKRPAMSDPARGSRPAGGGVAAALLPGTRPAAPGDLPPRNRPIYYVWAASPDHGVSGKNKTDAPISCQEAVCGSVLSNSHRSS